MEKNKIIYVASPYSSSDDAVRKLNYIKVSFYTANLIAKGLVALSPIAYGHPLLDFAEMPSDWKFWQHFCITFLEKCDIMHVLMLPGWDKSRGVLEEIEYCEKHGIPVQYITEADYNGLF